MENNHGADDGLNTGRRLRDEGAGRAGSGLNGPAVTEWRANAADALDALMASGQPFSADDLVDMVGMPPHPNMLGAAILKCSLSGQAERVGYRSSTRPSAHARVQGVWRGIS